jgi:hypothetical protein
MAAFDQDLSVETGVGDVNLDPDPLLKIYELDPRSHIVPLDLINVVAVAPEVEADVNEPAQLVNAPTCIGDDILAAAPPLVPLPSFPKYALPQAHKVPSVFTANIVSEVLDVASSAQVPNVPTWTGELRLTVSPRPSMP